MNVMKAFTAQDQNSFARLSGDYNPLHVDNIIARRSQFGRQVVHGLHLVLWAIDQAFSNRPPVSIKTLSCTFRHTVGIDEPIECLITRNDEHELAISIVRYGTECVVFQIGLAPSRAHGVFIDAPLGQEACKKIPSGEFNGLTGITPLQVDTVALAQLFPSVVVALPIGQVALLLGSTRIVGMYCPGYYSLFYDLKLAMSDAAAETSPEVKWQVQSYDDRFNTLKIGLSAPCGSGTLTALARPEPQEQLAMQEILPKIDGQLYANRKALVIGGSRGLGELCAKMLAAGGADVRITYHKGSEDAERVVNEIVKTGKKAAAFAYDVLSPSVNLQLCLGQNWTPTHVYYFATPPIFVAGRSQFSMEWFNVFCRYYVEGFYACWQALRKIAPSTLVMFYPSSVAVAEVPNAMGEYAAAKAAGENLCHYLSNIDKKLELRMLRLPRLPSDQTLSIMATKTEDPFQVLQDVLR